MVTFSYNALRPVPAVNSRGAQACAGMGVPQGSFSYLRRRFIIVLNAICRDAGRISATRSSRSNGSCPRYASMRASAWCFRACLALLFSRTKSKALDVPARSPSDHTSPPHGSEVKHPHAVGRCRAGAEKPLDPVRDLSMPADGGGPTGVAVPQQHSFLRAHGRILGASDCRTLNPIIPKRGAR